MLLLVHGEVTGSHIDIFDRERVFIEAVLQPLLERMPQLKVVLEHITTKHAVEFVNSASDNVAASVTPQHMLLNRNAIFEVSCLQGCLTGKKLPVCLLLMPHLACYYRVAFSHTHSACPC